MDEIYQHYRNVKVLTKYVSESDQASIKKEIIKFDSYSLSFSLSANQLCVQLPHNTARGSYSPDSRAEYKIRFVGAELS